MMWEGLLNKKKNYFKKAMKIENIIHYMFKEQKNLGYFELFL